MTPPLLFWRRPPQSNCPPSTVSHLLRLESQQCVAGIPTAAPIQLTPYLLSLPAILYTHCRNPMPGCSKAPRGLSVLLQVTGIFTGITTSPGLRPRQLPNHFTIRAGRNLPDKEFRYLRTVIVTAACSPGLQFGSLNPPLNLPALGRCQPIYVAFRLSIDLCFW